MIKKRCIKCQIEGPVVEGRNVYIGCQSCGCSDVIFLCDEELVATCTTCNQEFLVSPKDLFSCIHKSCGGTSWIIKTVEEKKEEKEVIEKKKEESRKIVQTISGSVSGIVVCHNAVGLTKKCIGLLKSTGCDEIILIDNGSTDETEEWAMGEKIIYIKNQINLGCGIGRNQGAKHANGEYLFFIDNDQFVPSDVVSRMLALKKDLVGTNLWRVVDGKDSEPVDFEAVKSVQRDMYVGSGGLLIKKEIFEALKGYDERFSPAWYEDTDFCFRARKEGYSIEYLHDASIEHLGNQTIKEQETFSSEEAKKNGRQLFFDIWGLYLKTGDSAKKGSILRRRSTKESSLKEHAKANLLDMKKILDELNIVFWLDCGTVLGEYRDRTFCEGDEDDIDLGTWDAYRIYIPEIIDEAKKKGFILKNHWEYNGTGHEIVLAREGSRIDLYFNMRDSKRKIAYCYFYKNHKPIRKVVVPLKFYTDLVKIKFLGSSFLRPNHIEEYLELRYGDWKTKIPRKDYNCYTAPDNTFLTDVED